jgi:hypothetical protein
MPMPRLGAGAGLEYRGLREGADIGVHLEVTERAATLGVHVALRHPLTVEVGHLADEVVVVEKERPVGADGEREGIAGRRSAGFRGRDRDLCGVSH